MKIPSGTTDQVIYFVAVDATDLSTRETGLTGFTVYRSRNGAAGAAFTTPTVTEVDGTNMQGIYKLLLDEDMTIGAGNDSEEMVFHITCAGMAPVTRTIELYRPIGEQVLAFPMDSAEASATAKSLHWFLALLLYKSDLGTTHTGEVTVFKTDGVTELFRQVVTQSDVLPVTAKLEAG